MTQTRRDMIYLYSGDRNTSRDPNSEEFTFTVYPSRQHIEWLELVKLELTFSWYPFRSTNNHIHFKDSGGTTRDATITPGSYKKSEFAARIKTTLENKTTDTFTVTIDNNTAKITILNNTGTWEILTSTETKAAWKSLGFISGSSDKTGSTSYTADNLYDLSGDDFFYIISDLTDTMDDITVESTGKTPILAKIPIDTTFKQKIIYEPYERIRLQLRTKILNRIKLKIVDRNFDALPLNGLDWSPTFRVQERVIQSISQNNNIEV